MRINYLLALVVAEVSLFEDGIVYIYKTSLSKSDKEVLRYLWK